MSNDGLRIVNMFLNAGKKLDAFGEAARHGEVGLLRQLVESGVDANCRNSLGTPAIVLAASGGSVEAIRFLLESGADPNAIDVASGETALFSCLWARHTFEVYAQCCTELIRKGANTNVKNEQGLTIQQLAEDRGIRIDSLTCSSQLSSNRDTAREDK